MGRYSHAPSIVILLMGIIIACMGISKLIKHYIFIKRPHETIIGEIVGCDKEVHHYRWRTETLCRARLKFEYDGKVREIMDENAVPERIFDGLYNSCLKCRIRITERDAYSATLDYAECLNVKRNHGFILAGAGVLFVIIGLM